MRGRRDLPTSGKHCRVADGFSPLQRGASECVSGVVLLPRAKFPELQVVHGRSADERFGGKPVAVVWS